MTENGWQIKPLGELAENYDSLRIPVKEFDRRSGKFPYYGASGIIDYIDEYLFDGEYLLVAEDGENLKTRKIPIAFLANGRFWVNNHAHIIRGKDNAADTKFLMYSLINSDISGFLTGSTLPKLTQDNLRRIPIFTPPLPEQRAIAHSSPNSTLIYIPGSILLKPAYMMHNSSRAEKVLPSSDRRTWVSLGSLMSSLCCSMEP